MWRHLLLLVANCLLATAESVDDGVWIGHSPLCSSTADSCHRLGLEFVRSDTAGDGAACWRGQKVLCRHPPLPRQLQETDASRLTVVSYNIFSRPFLISHDGQRERTCHIPRSLLSAVPTADVLVFQEAFTAGCLSDSRRLRLRSLLRHYGFGYSTRTVGVRRWGLRINGGVFIASKWPIAAEAQMVYRNWHSATADSLANKGAVYARLYKKGTTYHVFGTHLQAEDGAEFDACREQQALELRSFVDSRNIPADEAVVLAGDFNADRLGNAPHVNRLLSNMGARLPQLADRAAATYDPARNDMVEAGVSLRQWLDYVTFSTRHRRPKAAILRSLQPLAPTAVRLCVSAKLQLGHVSPDSSVCSLTRVTRQLSDHFPVVAEFLF